MYKKNIPIALMLLFLSTCLQARVTFGQSNKQESIRPYGIRRVFEQGLGDRYYQGVPAGTYAHLWPRWKSKIIYNQNLWRYRRPPKWVSYYDYPYISWPNQYYESGVPYYNQTKPTSIRNTKKP